MDKRMHLRTRLGAEDAFGHDYDADLAVTHDHFEGGCNVRLIAKQ